MCLAKNFHSTRVVFLCFLVTLFVMVGCAGGGSRDSERVAGNGDIVAIHYTGTLDSGEVFDSTEGRDPFIFTVGSRQVISGFDDAVRGLKVSESKRVVIPPGEAYGEYDDELILEFPNSEMPLGPEGTPVYQLGDTLIFQGGSQGFVVGMSDTTVSVDANHRLAGQTLTFEIELISIK